MARSRRPPSRRQLPFSFLLCGKHKEIKFVKLILDSIWTKPVTYSRLVFVEILIIFFLFLYFFFLLFFLKVGKQTSIDDLVYIFCFLFISIFHSFFPPFFSLRITFKKKKKKFNSSVNEVFVIEFLFVIVRSFLILLGFYIKLRS